MTKARPRANSGAVLTIGALCVASLGAGAARADEAADRGFSYFVGLGREGLRYNETGSLLPYRSTVHTSSPLLITGALYPVSPSLLVSIDSNTTFFPNHATETWTATGPVFNGVTLTSPLLQQDSFSLSQTHTGLLAHLRLRDQLFATIGPSFRSQSFKRYAFVVGPDNAVQTPASQTIDESSSELLLDAGIELESERVRVSPNHYGLRASVGVPLWRRVENTSAPQAQFNGTGGYDLALEGRYSWSLLTGMHLGAWGRYGYNVRSSQSGGAGIELPRSSLRSVGYGFEMLWKL